MSSTPTSPPPAEPAPGEPEPAESHEPDALAELEDKWKRALADTENLRKRLAKDLAAGQVAERRRVTAAWLPIVDNLELALGHAEDDDSPIVRGVRAIRDQAVELLAALGFPRDDEVGIPFDPARHEAVSVVAGDEPGMVVSVVRPGYGRGEQQLRPAAVVVSGDRES